MGTQQFGTIQTSKGIVNAMLCIDKDLPNEYLVQMWSSTFEGALLFSTELPSETKIKLRVQKLYRVNEWGGLWLPALASDEIAGLDPVTQYRRYV